ncbi:MAG TPA: large conductance mechanosensitive channel protein MscL, partial [Candidatus Acidoferrum sp.]|nr:large conductance mechanosensitive channel protein MscL [Candidatus Acidoferrum sp.]
IIGAAFGTIVKSMTDDLIMPLVGRVVGKMDFTNYYLPLTDNVQAGLALAEAKKQGAVLAYGNFLTIVLNFIILAFCIFLMVKAMNRLRRKEEAKAAPAPAAPTTTEVLLTDIRELLKAQRH